MVDILMGEVEGRSYKDGSRAQVIQDSRDEVSMNTRFEKLHETVRRTIQCLSTLVDLLSQFYCILH